MIEYAIHDTFDALSPKYDSPISADEMSAIANGSLDSEFELVRRGGVTLLRSIITSACDETLLKFRS